MATVYLIAAAALLLTMGLALIRALRGPTAYDRILAVNTFGTKTVLIIVLLGFINRGQDFADIAMAYALINFISVIAVLRFSELQLPQDPEELRRSRR